MWTQTTLGKLCKMYQPKTISAKEMVADGDYVVFGANGIIGRYDKYNHEEPQLLVTCRGATCGAVNVSEPFSWINGNAMVIKPDLEKVSLKYMEYLFRGGINLSTAITGAAQPQITRKSLEPIQFSYPPLAEQQRIVAKLDAAFAEIDRAIAIIHTKKIDVEILKSELLRELLTDDATMWTHGCIGDVLSLIQNGVNCKQDKSGVGDKVSRIETIADSNINYDKTGFAVLDEKQKAKAILHAGDILFSHINSPAHVGKTAIYDGIEPLYHGINLLRLQTIDAVDSRYFNMFLISLFQSGYWKRTSKQSVNQASVNQTDIKQVPFSYPPLAEQQRIVAKLDATFTSVEKFASLTAASEEQYSSLKSAILAQELSPSEAA